VSSNGQEYVTNATIPFEYYAQPEIELLTPTGGPALGGTLLRVFGTHLYAGTSGHRRCRVGVDGSPVPASFDPTSGALLCTTPASPGLTPATRPLLVALNVDHFDVSAASSPTFEYYAPPYLASIEPRSGFSNGTTVTFRGGALWRTEGDGTTGSTRCRFGNAMLNATLHPDDASAVTCIAPAAAVAALLRLGTRFAALPGSRRGLGRCESRRPPRRQRHWRGGAVARPLHRTAAQDAPHRGAVPESVGPGIRRRIRRFIACCS
jgi:hypothetical protein